jgi:plastocyanin
MRSAANMPAAGRHRAWLLMIVLLAGFALAGPALLVARNLPASDSSGGGSDGAAAAAPDAAAASATAKGGTTTVAMAGLKFSPATLSVRKGTTVVFDNDDVAPHTVTSQDDTIDSGVLNPGKSFSLVVAAGFKYRCTIHPFMTASVVVAT